MNDPSGHCEQNHDEGCWSLAEQLDRKYGIGLDYLGKLSYEQLSNGNIAAVLAYTLAQLDLVSQRMTTDADAMMSILNFAIEDVANGNWLEGLRYSASVFYRDIMGPLGVESGYAYLGLSEGKEFGTSGFRAKYGTGNQVEHFINEAYAIGYAKVTTHPPLGNMAGPAVAYGFEMFSFVQGGFRNSSFLPDARLGMLADSYTTGLYNSFTQQDRSQAGNLVLSQLKPLVVTTTVIKLYPEEDYMRPPMPPTP